MARGTPLMHQTKKWKRRLRGKTADQQVTVLLELARAEQSRRRRKRIDKRARGLTKSIPLPPEEKV